MISVIVPVYNVEKYLDKCIQSILNQTYRDFELILVDDGSTDRSGEMCDQYAIKDERLRVIHKENGGQSEARNYGVSYARGEFIAFVDSDDYIHERYLEILDCMNDHENSITVVGMKKVYSDEICSQRIQKNEATVKLSGRKAAINALYQKGIDTSPWGILLPKRVVVQYPFPVNKYHEDDLTTYKYYMSVDEVVISRESLYFYRQRPDSTMHKIGKPIFDELEAADKVVLDAAINYPFLYSAAKSKQFSNYVQVLLRTYDSFGNSDIQGRILEVLDEYKLKMLKDKNARIKNRLAALLLMGDARLLYYVNKMKLKITGTMRKATDVGSE